MKKESIIVKSNSTNEFIENYMESHRIKYHRYFTCGSYSCYQVSERACSILASAGFEFTYNLLNN